MIDKCIFYVGTKPSKEVKEKVKNELGSTGNVHEIEPAPFRKRGGLTRLIKQTGGAVNVCVDRSSVPISEINIAIINKLSFHIVDKTNDKNGEIVHSSEFTSRVN